MIRASRSTRADDGAEHLERDVRSDGGKAVGWEGAAGAVTATHTDQRYREGACHPVTHPLRLYSRHARASLCPMTAGLAGSRRVLRHPHHHHRSALMRCIQGSPHFGVRVPAARDLGPPAAPCPGAPDHRDIQKNFATTLAGIAADQSTGLDAIEICFADG